MVSWVMSINNPHATRKTRLVAAVLPAQPFDERDRAIAEEFPEVFTTGTSGMICSQAELDWLAGGDGEEKAEE